MDSTQPENPEPKLNATDKSGDDQDFVDLFDVVPPLSWDNPADRRILLYLQETRGFEIAELATLPTKEYLLEVYQLMAINNRDDDDDGQ